MRAKLIFLIILIVNIIPADAQKDPVKLEIDASETVGEMLPIYSFFGYDEPNYTYSKNGRKLLAEIAGLSPVPVYVRT
ncbi:MAG: hypothetical protein JW833_17995, partial [Prolixibacteraceae bacterium]|nr:hypothetical protein [Prolixibacteraceae bacterium]